jgi:hypothetical protein
MGIKVVATSQEASSAPRDPLPAGKYLVSVTDGNLKASKSQKNSGKPYYALELTVNDGKYDGRKLWTNVMCFEGALYSIVQMLKALGVEFDASGNFQVPAHDENEIPELDWFIGQQFVVAVKITPPSKGPDGKEYDARNDVKSWDSAKTWTGAPASEETKSKGGNSLLPQ